MHRRWQQVYFLLNKFIDVLIVKLPACNTMLVS